MIGLSESMLLGKKLGIDLKKLNEIINTSTGQCWSSTSYSPVPGLMADVPSSKNYEGGFLNSLMLKDLNLAKNATELNFPMATNAVEIYTKMVDCGMSGKDFSSVYEYLENKLS